MSTAFEHGEVVPKPTANAVTLVMLFHLCYELAIIPNYRMCAQAKPHVTVIAVRLMGRAISVTHRCAGAVFGY